MKKTFYILFFFIVSLKAYSTDYTTAGNGSWTDSATWGVATYPSSISDNADIANNDSVWVDIDASLTGGGVLIFNQNSILFISSGDTLTVDSISILNNAKLYVDGVLNVTNGVYMKNNSGLNVQLNGEINIGGSFEGAPNVTLNVDGAIAVAGDFTLASGSITGIGSITVDGTVDIPDGSDPGTVVNSTLPIELLSFNATFDNNHVVLDWSTASEINNDYFTIERSTDGVNFEILNIVNGAGNSNDILNYETIDNNPLEGTSYYRLKQTDYDGKFEYSSLVSVKNQKKAISQDMNVYPNPVLKNSQNVNVKINGFNSDEAVTVKVINIFGKVEYYNKAYSGFDGSLALSLDAGIFNSVGYHIISVSSSNKSFSKRLLVK